MVRFTNKAIVLTCCLAAAGCELSQQGAAKVEKEARELALFLAAKHRKERA